VKGGTNLPIPFWLRACSGLSKLGALGSPKNQPLELLIENSSLTLAESGKTD